MMQFNKQLIPRKLLVNIKNKLFRDKAIIVYGARQVGKTTLINSLLNDLGLQNKDITYLNGDDFDVREILSNPNVVKLEGIIGKSKILFIDEAQRIPEIGIVIKIIVDRIKNVQVIATGSSSFLLSRSIKEPLTGRAYEFVLYPLTFGELVEHSSLLEEKRKLERRLIFGSYPEIVSSPGEEKDLLELLSGSYLYRDLFVMPTVSRPELLEKITKAIALQIGSEVSTVEIGQLVGADRLTVEKYIDLLEKAFIVFRLPALNRNVRNEIKKGKKIYFYDNGIRNAVIKNFNEINLRNDVGALWENYCISERIKFLAYSNHPAQSYFWRTTQQQEIDYVEEYDNSFSAYEFKFNIAARPKFSKTFISSYPVKHTNLITPDNIEEFVL
ncbi:MAG: ATP-binding protein [Melioribacteraceae bacterium]